MLVDDGTTQLKGGNSSSNNNNNIDNRFASFHVVVCFEQKLFFAHSSRPRRHRQFVAVGEEKYGSNTAAASSCCG